MRRDPSNLNLKFRILKWALTIWLDFTFAFLLITLSATPTSDSASRPQKEFIVWNVGQGLWATEILPLLGRCNHFDMGGEKSPVVTVAKYCREGLNEVYLSHWDWDHIGFLKTGRSHLDHLTLGVPPAGSGSKNKIQMLEKIFMEKLALEYTDSRADNRSSKGSHAPDVDSEIILGSRVIADARRNSFSKAWGDTKPKAAISSNDQSNIIRVGRFLLPGDSTTHAENVWVPKLHSLTKVSVLILGHHGSRTSTGDILLRALPHLRQAIASSRHKRYGHPHHEVCLRLKRKGVALLRTEDWGHIHFLN